MKIKASDVIVPLDVPKAVRGEYVQNYLTITRESGRLILFVGDQKVEHLNRDFLGEGIHPQDGNPEHLFRIASKCKIGIFATQLGLIARYGMDYPDASYLVKLNSKTDLVADSQVGSLSQQWLDVKQVAEFRDNSGLKIMAVGYTVLLGSMYESKMLQQAAQVVYQAHQKGLIAVLWVCPQGKAVSNERDSHLIAGATGVGACLGCDFVRVDYPQMNGADSKELFKEAILAAGRTKVISSGGSSREIGAFLGRIHDQIHISGAEGISIGRNIHQRSLDEAIRLCDAIHDIVIEGSTVEDALKHMISL
jgi:DhnA family fructose-bisphosphate aldolase class Ia